MTLNAIRSETHLQAKYGAMSDGDLARAGRTLRALWRDRPRDEWPSSGREVRAQLIACVDETRRRVDMATRPPSRPVRPQLRLIRGGR